MHPIETTWNDYLISTNHQKLDIPAIHDFLTHHSGWANGISLPTVEKSIQNSLCFGLYHRNVQIGFARVISDYATIAYLGDVYVLNDYRGRGLSKKLMDAVMAHPQLQGLRRWILLTSTAEWLYTKYNFTPLPKPELYMELYNPEVYKQHDE